MIRASIFLFTLVLTFVSAVGSSAVSAAMVYWTTSSGGTINRQNDDGTGSVEVVLSGLNSPRGIAVHPTLGIFWADPTDDVIYRANFDGTGQTAVVTGTNNPLAMTMDLINERIYWSDSNGFATNRIQSAKLDGTDQQTFTTFGSLSSFTGIAVDPGGGKLYWVDTNVVGNWRADLDGTNFQKIMTHIGGTGGPNDIAVDPVGGKVYWSASGATNTIEKADLDGSNRQTFVTGFSNARGVVVDSLGGKVYWHRNGAIERANIDGSGREAIVSGSPNAWGITLGPVPEPSGFILGAIGGFFVLVFGVRQRRRAAA